MNTMRRHYDDAPVRFRHTQWAFYLTALAAAACIFYDSTQSIVQRYSINKKWFYLYGAMCAFAYWYTRPLIRRRLGSAAHGTINWGTIYAVWLCCAVFYHLPSLDSLGIDVKADVSMLLTVFLLSLVMLGALCAAHSGAVAFRLLHPRLLHRNSRAMDVFTTVVLNSMSLAIACSTYYSLCGNAGPEIGGTDAVRAAVCHRWLRPLSAVRHPTFSGWVLYGEGGANATAAAAGAPGGGGEANTPTAAAVGLAGGTQAAISPVFTAWLTMFVMFVANSLADYAAGAAASSAYSVGDRRDLLASSRQTHRLRRRRSAEYPSTDRPRSRSRSAAESYASLAPFSRSTSRGIGLDAILKTVSSVGSLWSPHALEQVGLRAASALLFRDDFGIGLSATPTIDGVDDATPVQGVGDPDVTAGVGVRLAPDAPSPSFLPMFPWYSGTSADLIKTLFDLLVSVKVFLGRFDQRTLQAATAAGAGGAGGSAACGGAAPPHDGDGFTYEHLADQEEAWIDFCADTGDGGDSTYSIARCLAAPHVTVEVPKEMAAAAGHSHVGGAPRVLPRATCLVHGGDLAYPNPTDETYEQRLWGPYQDALPPPRHIHPGNLVVTKPDLPLEYWVAGEQEGCRCGAVAAAAAAGAAADGPAGVCHACRKAGALRVYDGPTAFFIPGNHDWIDGLETYTRHVVHKGWIGGWLLPQEKSYYALRLPQGWWLFALDLALVDDLDMAQYRYFARIAEERMEPGDAAIVVSHAPWWLINWFWGRHEGKNLRQLLRGPLRGRARLHLAGDLHFYMRHTFKPYPKEGDSLGVPGGISPPASELSTPAGGSPVAGGSPTSSRCPTPLPAFAPQPPGQLHQSLLNRLKGMRTAAGASPTSAASPAGAWPGNGGSSGGGGGGLSGALAGSLPPQPAPFLQPSGTSDDEGNGGEAGSILSGGSDGGDVLSPLLGTSPPAFTSPLGSSPSLPIPMGGINATTSPPTANGARGLLRTPSGLLLVADQQQQSQTPLGGSPSTHSSQSKWWSGLRVRTPRLGATNSAPGAPGTGSDGGAAGGGGGGALPRRGPGSISGHSADGEWEAAPPGWMLTDPEHLVVCGSGGAFLHPTHVFSYSRFRPEHDPAAGPMYVRPPPPSTTAGAPSRLNRRTFASESSLSLHRLAAENPPQQPRPAGGEYRCQASFPSPQQSLKLGRSNLHAFRHVNSRFDIIGGVFYYLLVVSVLPRCSGIAAVLDAHSVWEGVKILGTAGVDTLAEIFASSYVSLAAVAVLFLVTLGFAKTGGVGAISGISPAARRKPEYRGFALAVRARLGGAPAQLAYAAAHAAVHLSAAIALLLLLELGVETVMRYEGVGKDGYHSLYRWYRSFEAQHFPDPAGVKSALSTLTLGVYPNAIKWAFALFDVPEAIAVSRTAMCAAAGAASGLTRLQTLGYYVGVLLYFWVLATPTVGLIFGLYLYVSGNWLHVHYDESFSALQVEHHKGFLKLHVTRTGELEVYSLGLNQTPTQWREDPRWKAPGGGGSGVEPHRARWPSRWIPVTEGGGGGGGRKGYLRTAMPPEAQLEVVDYFVVRKEASIT